VPETAWLGRPANSKCPSVPPLTTPLRDLVERQFRASAPNRLWVADLTYVKTHSGWVFGAFIVDVFSRRVVGWQASRSLRGPTWPWTPWRWPSGRAVAKTSEPSSTTLIAASRAIHVRGLHQGPGEPWDPLQPQPARQLLGQRGGGELLLDAQARPPLPPQVADPGGGEERHLRVHRGLLHPGAPPFDARRPQSGRLRIRPRRCVLGLTKVSVKAGQAQGRPGPG